MNEMPDADLSSLRDTRHPRDSVMEAAGGEFLKLFHDIQTKYALSAFETLYLVATLNRGVAQLYCLSERETKPQ